MASTVKADPESNIAFVADGHQTIAMTLSNERYIDQIKRWPEQGRHIIAYYDDETIIVYQAYHPSIGRFAIANSFFGGDFNYSRMSWIKPNFLWMMYRSGWGTKEGQEVTLAVRLGRKFFDSILARAVPSSFNQTHFPSQKKWKEAVADSDVRLQWDPDHDPHGRKLARRAIQLGLRGEVLEAFGKNELLEVIDMTEFVATERERLNSDNCGQLMMPLERVYTPDDPNIRRRLLLD